MNLPLQDLLSIVVFPFGLGAALLRTIGIRWRSDPLAWAGWAWLAGSFGTGLVMFAWSFCGPNYLFESVPRLVITFLFLAGLAAGRFVRPAPWADGEAPRASRVERGVFAFCVAVLFALVLQRVVLATNLPVLTDDEAEFWAYKAKLIFTSGGFNDRFAAAVSAGGAYNMDYPNLNPLLQLWAFVHAGNVLHVANRLPIQLFALAQFLVFAACVRRHLRPGLAALVVLLFVATPQARFQAGLAQGDLAVGFGLLVAFDAWTRWRASGETAWFRLAMLGLAFSLWSKNEALLYVVCSAAAASAVYCIEFRRTRRRPRPSPAALWVALPLGIYALHAAFNTHYGLSSGFLANERRDEGLVSLVVEQASERAGSVGAWFATKIAFAELVPPSLGARHSNLVFLALLLLAAIFPRAILRRTELAVPLLALLCALLGIGLVFVGAPHDVHWHLKTAAERVVYQLVPVAWLWVAAALAANRVFAPARSELPD